ncbi:MAG TPA: maleylacetoacetate isomerase [Steroidobacter sp.]
MKLYNYFRSSAAFRVRIALNLKGLNYDYVSKALPKNEQRAADYLAVNPQGLIPALEIDGTVISQSVAIIEYLNELHPQPPLLPADPLARAQVRSMALAIACDTHPLNNLRVLNYLRQDLAQNDDGVNTWYRHWVSEGFRGLELQVAKHSSARRHCFGDSLSLADVCLAPQMYNARRFNCDLTPFPTLVAISAHLESLPAFDTARPEVQPDAR